MNPPPNDKHQYPSSALMGWGLCHKLPSPVVSSINVRIHSILTPKDIKALYKESNMSNFNRFTAKTGGSGTSGRCAKTDSPSRESIPAEIVYVQLGLKMVVGLKGKKE